MRQQVSNLSDGSRTRLGILRNGLATGLVLQLAIGPVFFFIVNLAVQHSAVNGFAGVLAVTIVDFTYINLAILGLGKALQRNRIRAVFDLVSPVILAIFGVIILKSAAHIYAAGVMDVDDASPLASFLAVLALTASSPMTIVFFTSLFSTKATEYGYARGELYLFGIGTAMATFLFMGGSVVALSMAGSTVPSGVTELLNVLVGCALVGYGVMRFAKSLIAFRRASNVSSQWRRVPVWRA